MKQGTNLAWPIGALVVGTLVVGALSATVPAPKDPIAELYANVYGVPEKLSPGPVLAGRHGGFVWESAYAYRRGTALNQALSQSIIAGGEGGRAARARLKELRARCSRRARCYLPGTPSP